jgi:hypothetical protein
MRACMVFALAAGLVASPSLQAAARDMAGHGGAVVRVQGRDRGVDFDRFSHRHHHRRFVPVGFFSGFDTFDTPEPFSASPVSGGFSAPPPLSPKVTGDRPPCRETTSVGVVIERGGACSHGTTP